MPWHFFPGASGVATGRQEPNAQPRKARARLLIRSNPIPKAAGLSAAGLLRYWSNQSPSSPVSRSMPSQPWPPPFLTTSLVLTPTLFIFLTKTSDC